MFLYIVAENSKAVGKRRRLSMTISDTDHMNPPGPGNLKAAFMWANAYFNQHGQLLLAGIVLAFQKGIFFNTDFSGMGTVVTKNFGLQQSQQLSCSMLHAFEVSISSFDLKHKYLKMLIWEFWVLEIFNNEICSCKL